MPINTSESEIFKKWIAAHPKILGAPNVSVSQFEKIPGDASTRIYFRVTYSNGLSHILMKLEEPITNELEKYPFLAIQSHLKETGVTVPNIISLAPELGYILLEDLGDITLLRRLQNVTDIQVERHLYEQVIDRLVQMHFESTRVQKKVNGQPLDCFSLRFDREKLMWEVNFTIEHFYQKYLNRQMSPHHLNAIRDGLGSICSLLDAEPTVFTHRDFHSRNVMVASDQRLVFIDFQDARMGPKQYDLASLLKDSYYQLDQNQIDNLIHYYIARYEAVSGERIDSRHFKKIFDLMAVQRNFKAIGSFASFHNRRGNSSYLKYIGNTFENIRQTLLKYPEYSELREALFYYYYF